MVLETERLVLRRWQPADLVPFAELNADPRVMEFFPAPLSLAETERLIGSRRKNRTAWLRFLGGRTQADPGAHFGFIGLNVPSYPLPFSPCVEIGWRLACRHWGKGLAQEAARASLRHAFTHLALDEVVSFTGLGEGHPLRAHVLYRIRKPRAG
jgi:RimJ/RimL family protein N-acetyltransferase